MEGAAQSDFTFGLPIRKEVLDFIQAAEALLSPDMNTSALTPKECELVMEHLMAMSHAKHPWCKGLPINT
jgi:hypothetical protein